MNVKHATAVILLALGLASCEWLNAPVPERPEVIAVRPADGADNVPLNTGVGTDLSLPTSGVDPTTLSNTTVRLSEQSTGRRVSAQVGTSGGFDTITLQPLESLEPETAYVFEVTDNVQDQAGVPFVSFWSTFTTGTDEGTSPIDGVAFEMEVVASGYRYTSLAIGPDGRLYGGTVFGDIHRYVIEADGSLTEDGLPGQGPVIKSIGSDRLMIGFAFDPGATADELVAWVSHSELVFTESSYGADWTGTITRLSGPDLATQEDFVVGLPRSAIDHVTNSIEFGPDGRMYVPQGSNSGMGGADAVWQWRPEHLLTGAILRVDQVALDALPAGALPLNVRTEDRGAENYDPFAPDAPVTIFATGVRNAYDLVWHSNGQLYAPTNASAAGNNVPRTPEALPPSCNARIDGLPYDGPIINNDLTGDDVYTIDAEYQTPPDGSPADDGGYRITATQPDWLFRIEPDGYYGHPNPSRCEWVMDGGNNAAWPNFPVSQYETGTPADPNFRGFAYAFTENASANGVIEYQSDTFGGALQGKLLVARFSVGNDIVVLTPGGTDLDIVDASLGNEGFTGFNDPLDLVEDTSNGFIYVAEFDRGMSGLSVESEDSLDRFGGIGTLQTGEGNPRLTLLRPAAQ